MKKCVQLRDVEIGGVAEIRVEVIQGRFTTTGNPQPCEVRVNDELIGGLLARLLLEGVELDEQQQRDISFGRFPCRISICIEPIGMELKANGRPLNAVLETLDSQNEAPVSDKTEAR